jgi:predicted porin
MKFKTTAIALAIAGTVATPLAIQAGEGELYASARIGVWNVDEGGASNLEVSSFDSRFGAQGETDLGNGLNGFGRYEWDVDENDFSVRHRYVGLKGDFGSVLLGQTYHTFFNFIVDPLDIPWWHSGYTMVNYRSRTDNAVTYAGGMDNFNFGASVYMVKDGDAVAKGGVADDEDDIDAWEIAGSMAIGEMTLAVGAQGTETTQGSYGTDDEVYGVVLSGIGIGETTLGVSFMNQKDDNGVVGDLLIGNAYVHLEYLMVDSDSASSVSGDDEDKLSTTLGYTQSLGRKTTMWYELNYIDNDTGDSDDDRTAVMAVLSYDII